MTRNFAIFSFLIPVGCALIWGGVDAGLSLLLEVAAGFFSLGVILLFLAQLFYIRAALEKSSRS